jgi:hypothetical protein
MADHVPDDEDNRDMLGHDITDEEEGAMKTVFCDLCGQQLTDEEVDGSVRMPSEHGTLTMSPIVYIEHRDRLDVCWRCLAERILAVAPPRQASL